MSDGYHGWTHKPGGTDPITNSLHGRYESTADVPPATSLLMEWLTSLGDDLLDISDPEQPVVRQAGIYALMFTGSGPQFEPTGEVESSYFNAISRIELTDDTHEFIDFSHNGLFLTNDVDGTDEFFVASDGDLTTTNFSYDDAATDTVTILTNGVYRLRYLVYVNPSFFINTAYEVNLIADGSGSIPVMNKAVYVDETFNSPDTSADQAVLESVFRVSDAPQTIQFSTHQRSGNDWLSPHYGTTEVQLLRWGGSSGGSEVATVSIAMDAAGGDLFVENTWPLQARWTGDDPRPSPGTVTGVYYIPAGGVINASISHSADTTQSFDYRAVLQLIG